MTKEECYTSLIADEDEAIEGYLKAKEAFMDDQEACDVFNHIIEEEKEHIEEIKQLRARKETAAENYSLSGAFEDIINREFADKEEHTADFQPLKYEGVYADGFDTVEDLMKALAEATNKTFEEITNEYEVFIDADGCDLSRRINLVLDLYDPYLEADEYEYASILVTSRMFDAEEVSMLLDKNCPFMTREEKLAYIESVK